MPWSWAIMVELAAGTWFCTRMSTKNKKCAFIVSDSDDNELMISVALLRWKVIHIYKRWMPIHGEDIGRTRRITLNQEDYIFYGFRFSKIPHCGFVKGQITFVSISLWIWRKGIPFQYSVCTPCHNLVCPAHAVGQRLYIEVTFCLNSGNDPVQTFTIWASKKEVYLLWDVVIHQMTPIPLVPSYHSIVYYLLVLFLFVGQRWIISHFNSPGMPSLFLQDLPTCRVQF